MKKKGAENYLGYLIRLVTHGMRADIDKALSAHELSAPQYATLSLVAHYADSSGAELARRFRVTAQTMSGIIAQLEARDLVGRSSHATHKRVLTVRITPEGRRRLKACDALTQNIESQMLLDLSEAEQRELRRLLELCAARLRVSPGGDI